MRIAQTEKMFEGNDIIAAFMISLVLSLSKGEPVVRQVPMPDTYGMATESLTHHERLA
jgi:hypothetical protein